MWSQDWESPAELSQSKARGQCFVPWSTCHWNGKRSIFLGEKTPFCWIPFPEVGLRYEPSALNSPGSWENACPSEGTGLGGASQQSLIREPSMLHFTIDFLRWMSAHRWQGWHLEGSSLHLHCFSPCLALREWKQQWRGFCFLEVPLPKNNERGWLLGTNIFHAQRNTVVWQLRIYWPKCHKFPSFEMFTQLHWWPFVLLRRH